MELQGNAEIRARKRDRVVLHTRIVHLDFRGITDKEACFTKNEGRYKIVAHGRHMDCVPKEEKVKVMCVWTLIYNRSVDHLNLKGFVLWGKRCHRDMTSRVRDNAAF